MNTERYNILAYIYKCKKTIFYTLNQYEQLYIISDWYFKTCQPLVFSEILDNYGIKTNTFNGNEIAKILFDVNSIRLNISTWYGIKICILAIYNYMLGFLKNHEKVFKCLSDTQIKLIERVLFEITVTEYDQTINNWEVGLKYDLHLLGICVKVSNLTIHTVKKIYLKKTLKYFHNLYENNNIKYIDECFKEHDIKQLFIFQIYYEKILLSLYLSQHSLDSHTMLQLIQFVHQGFRHSWFEFSKNKPIELDKYNKEIINISGQSSQLGNLYLVSTVKNFPVTTTYQLLLQELGNFFEFTYADSKHLKHHVLNGESDHVLFDNSYMLSNNYHFDKKKNLEYLYVFKETLNSLTNQVLNLNIFINSIKNPDPVNIKCFKQRLLTFDHKNLTTNYFIEYLLWMLITNPYILNHLKI
jgi:hypothetical protein